MQISLWRHQPFGKRKQSRARLVSICAAFAGYHLQQAAEKMIKLQIYGSGVKVDHSKMFRHSLDDLIGYAVSLGIPLYVPSWVNEKKYVITSWEAEGRYNLHFVVRMDTLKRCYTELIHWRIQQFPKPASIF